MLECVCTGIPGKLLFDRSIGCGAGLIASSDRSIFAKDNITTRRNK
jgi:hypothetical protein